MAETITIEIKDDRAYKFLKDLEEQKLLKLIREPEQSPIPLSEKYRGVFTADDAKSFDNHTNTMRNEWPNT